MIILGGIRNNGLVMAKIRNKSFRFKSICCFKNQLRVLIFLSEKSILKSPLKIWLFLVHSAAPNSLEWAFHFEACDVTRDGETTLLPGNNIVEVITYKKRCKLLLSCNVVEHTLDHVISLTSISGVTIGWFGKVSFDLFHHNPSTLFQQSHRSAYNESCDARDPSRQINKSITALCNVNGSPQN
jgi:hypothetical protein